MKTTVKERELEEFGELEILKALYERSLRCSADCAGGMWSLTAAFKGKALDNLVSLGAVEFSKKGTEIRLTAYGVGIILYGAVEFNAARSAINITPASYGVWKALLNETFNVSFDELL